MHQGAEIDHAAHDRYEKQRHDGELDSDCPTLVCSLAARHLETSASQAKSFRERVHGHMSGGNEPLFSLRAGLRSGSLTPREIWVR